jgi:hypothetical protein
MANTAPQDQARDCGDEHKGPDVRQCPEIFRGDRFGFDEQPDDAGRDQE